MTTGNNTQTLRVIIEAVDRASATIKSISSRMATELTQFGRRMLFLGGIVTGFAGVAVRAALGQQEAQDQLRAIVEAQGGSWDALAEKVRNTVAAQDKLSKFTKTELFAALQVGVIAIGNLDAALRLLPAAVALASGTGKTVQEAMALITNAINGDAGARAALLALGIDISGTDRTFLSLATSIEQKYGPAVERANTPTAQLAKSIKDIGTAIGEILEPFVKPLASALSSIAASVQAWAKAHPDLAGAIGGGILSFGVFALVIGTVATVLGSLIRVIGFMVLAIHGLNAALLFLAANPIVLVIIAIIALIAIALLLFFHWEKVWSFIQEHTKSTTGQIINAILVAFFPIIGLIELILWAAANWDAIWLRMRDAAQMSANFFITTFNGILAAVENMVNGIIMGVNLAISALNKLPGVSIGHVGLVNLPRIPMLALSTGAIGTMPGGISGGLPGGISAINVTLNADHAVIGVDDLQAMILKTIRNAATGGGFNAVLQGR